METRISMDDFEWSEKFRPSNSPFEVLSELPRGVDVHNVWTGVEGDSGRYLIVNGYAVVNRLNYYVSEVPWEDGKYYEVTDCDDDWNEHYDRPKSSNEEIVLVAFVVYADDQEDAQQQVMDFLPTEKENPDVWNKASLDCWWVGMDERYDGSDNDSLEFTAYRPKEA